MAALFPAGRAAVCGDGDGTTVLGDGVTGFGGQVGSDFSSKAARVVQRADVSRRREWGTSGVQAHPNLGASFASSVFVDTCPSEQQ